MAPSQLLTNDENLTDGYTPCNAVSVFHDLICGHGIKVEYAWEICGTNCKLPMSGKPFICSACLIRDVRLEMLFESLDIDTVGEDIVMNDADMSRKNKIQQIANSELQILLAKGHRGCVMAPKLNNPKLQFFDQFLKEDGFAGINEEPRAGTPGVQYRRPHQRVQQGTNDEEQDVFTVEDFNAEWDEQERLEQDQLAQDKSSQIKSSPESDVEDEATQAVRDALSSCKLTGNFS